VPTIETKVPVPGLARGLVLLQILADGRSATLDYFAQQTGFPKSSILRQLETLQSMHMVMRDDSTREYFALQRLVPLRMLNRHMERMLEAVMGDLSETTGATAEWYVPVPEGMALVRRTEPPERGARVLAQIGFIRRWDYKHLETVSTLALAWHPDAPSPAEVGRKRFIYQTDGIAKPVSLSIIEKHVAEARRLGYGWDEAFNENGVRRIACVVLQNNELAGILAVAECYRPGAPRNLTENLKYLTGKAHLLFQNSNFDFLPFKLLQHSAPDNGVQAQAVS